MQMYGSLLVVGTICINRFSIFLVFFPLFSLQTTHLNFLQIFLQFLDPVERISHWSRPSCLNISSACVCVCVCTKRNLCASGVKVINAKPRHFWPKKTPEGTRENRNSAGSYLHESPGAAAAAAAGGASNENCVSSGQLQQTPVLYRVTIAGLLPADWKKTINTFFRL